MKLVTDFWSEGKNLETVVENPKLALIIKALDALDGVSRTMISLVGAKDGTILVGGPCQDGYLVNGTVDNLTFYSPKNTGTENKQVTCFIGGQDGVYRRDQFVSRQVAEIALRHFYGTQQLSPEIEWYARNGRGPRLRKCS